MPHRAARNMIVCDCSGATEEGGRPAGSYWAFTETLRHCFGILLHPLACICVVLLLVHCWFLSGIVSFTKSNYFIDFVFMYVNRGFHYYSGTALHQDSPF